MKTIVKEIAIGQKPTTDILKEIEEAPKREIVYTDDAPQLTAAQLSEFHPADPTLYRARKEQITLKIDADVLAAFRSTGKGYQSRMNAALRKAAFGSN